LHTSPSYAKMVTSLPLSPMNYRIELGVLMNTFLTKYAAEDPLAAIELSIIVNKAEQAAVAEVATSSV